MPATTKTPTMERVAVGTDDPSARTSFYLWRKDLELLRALYRGNPGGYAVHIRAAVNIMCNQLRQQLRATPHGAELLRKLNQDHIQ